DATRAARRHGDSGGDRTGLDVDGEVDREPCQAAGQAQRLGVRSADFVGQAGCGRDAEAGGAERGKAGLDQTVGGRDVPYVRQDERVAGTVKGGEVGHARAPCTRPRACARPGQRRGPAPNARSPARRTCTTSPASTMASPTVALTRACRLVDGTGGSSRNTASTGRCRARSIKALVGWQACTSTPMRAAVGSSKTPPKTATSRATAASARDSSPVPGWYAWATSRTRSTTAASRPIAAARTATGCI